MFDLTEKANVADRAFLVGLYQRKEEEHEAASLLEELAELVSTLGVTITGRTLTRCTKFNSSTLAGSGKLEEILLLAQSSEAQVVVFDNELSPAQQRNLEKVFPGLAVIDRQEVILDIFARRARTREAMLQVQLARLEYNLPRLKRAWTHLGRQGGAGGWARGEGEQQIEIDRRLIQHEIDGAKAELAEVRKQRATRRKTRQRIPIPNAAIVGYTNAGKSSLLNKLTGSGVLAEDKLFATLDTTTRRVKLPNGHPLLLTDTVGFVRKLPHKLVESFKATLEEAVLSDFLIHVVDASHPEAEKFYETTLEVLKELGAEDKRIITVFNKIDLVKDAPWMLAPLRIKHRDAVFVSIHSGEGIEALVDKIAQQFADSMRPMHLLIPHEHSEVVAQLHATGKVNEAKYEYDGIHVDALVSRRHASKFEPYEIKTEEEHPHE
ncbi:MAG: GTPase HflX [Kiritimatiellia bacterium]